MADWRPRLREFNQTAWDWLFNLRMGLGLLVFTPVDAAYLALQTGLPTRGFGLDFGFWFAAIVALERYLWVKVPAVRRATREEQNPGVALPPEPLNRSELLFGEVAGLMGVFLLLMAGGDPSHTVGASWEWGFRLAGAACIILGAYRLRAYAYPDPEEFLADDPLGE